MTTILYITNEGSEIPLRYSLRSLKFIDHQNVVVSGHLPDYVKGVIHVPGEDATGLRDINIQRKLLAGLKHHRTHDTVVMMCDDIFLLAPYKDRRTRHRGLLKDRVASLQDRPETDQFRRTMEATLRCLEAMGIPEPLDFGAHHPVYMDRDKAIETVEFSLSRDVPICITTLYQYMHDAPSVKGVQAKVERWIGRVSAPVLSTSAHVEKNYGFKEFMHFNLAKCEYEK